MILSSWFEQQCFVDSQRWRLLLLFKVQDACIYDFEVRESRFNGTKVVKISKARITSSCELGILLPPMSYAMTVGEQWDLMITSLP